MNGVEVLVPLAALLMPVAIVWIVARAGAQKRADTLATVRLALEKGGALDPAILQSLTPKRDPLKDLRVGAGLIGGGLGLAAFALALGTIEENARAAMIGIAAIPFFIGLALVGVYWYARRMRAEP